MTDSEAEVKAIPPLLLDIRAACEVLGGVGRSSLYVEIAAGRIKTVKIGARAFIARAELERYVEAMSA